MADDDLLPVTFYWRPGCSFCSSLRHGLLSAGVELEERNIWDEPEAATFVRSVARGNETVPTVVVGDVALVNPTRTEVLAVRSGEDAPTSAPGRLVRRLLGG
jgi:mycoredoxin